MDKFFDKIKTGEPREHQAKCSDNPSKIGTDPPPTGIQVHAAAYIAGKYVRRFL